MIAVLDKHITSLDLLGLISQVVTRQWWLSQFTHNTVRTGVSGFPKRIQDQLTQGGSPPPSTTHRESNPVEVCVPKPGGVWAFSYLNKNKHVSGSGGGGEVWLVNPFQQSIKSVNTVPSSDCGPLWNYHVTHFYIKVKLRFEKILTSIFFIL